MAESEEPHQSYPTQGVWRHQLPAAFVRVFQGDRQWN